MKVTLGTLRIVGDASEYCLALLILQHGQMLLKTTVHFLPVHTRSGSLGGGLGDRSYPPGSSGPLPAIFRMRDAALGEEVRQPV